MSAKEKWKAGDLEGARAVLTRSFEANPTSAQIWLAAAKVREYFRGISLLHGCHIPLLLAH